MTRLQRIWLIASQRKRKSARLERQSGEILLSDSEGRILYGSDGKFLYVKL